MLADAVAEKPNGSSTRPNVGGDALLSIWKLLMPRLQDIVSKLYRSPVGVRQVFALSRDDAERLPRLSSIAVISITAPERQEAQLEGFTHVLRLSFADVDFTNPNLSEKNKKRLVYAFTAEQARAVRQFVDCLPANITSVVVHCEGGFSRSCAIALGLHHLYGYRVEHERLTHANPSVFQVLTGKPITHLSAGLTTPARSAR